MNLLHPGSKLEESMRRSLAATLHKPKRTYSAPGKARWPKTLRSIPVDLTQFLAPSKRFFGKTSVAAPSERNAPEATAPRAAVEEYPHTPTSQAIPAAVAPPMTPQELEDDEDILEQMANARQLKSLASDEDLVDNPENTFYTYDEMLELRGSVGHTPPKIMDFALTLWEKLPLLQMPEHVESYSKGEISSNRGQLFGQSVTSSGMKRGKSALSAIFGEEKELHQKVLGVLNRVTDNRKKYPEVKNQLLRLPIPEADSASLQKVVNTFFIKAVGEQHFSALYAKLVGEICQVPEGQIKVGNEKDSVAYRLRRALLVQCEQEFNAPLYITDEEKKGKSKEEVDLLIQKKKNKVCGNIKFVGELFLRNIVSSRIILQIISQLLVGSPHPEDLRTKPLEAHIPQESDIDQLLTVLKTTGRQFRDTRHGVAIATIKSRLQYLTEIIRIPRVHCILLDILDLIARDFKPKLSEIYNKMSPEERDRAMFDHERGVQNAMSQAHAHTHALNLHAQPPHHGELRAPLPVAGRAEVHAEPKPLAPTPKKIAPPPKQILTHKQASQPSPPAAPETQTPPPKKSPQPPSAPLHQATSLPNKVPPLPPPPTQTLLPRPGSPQPNPLVDQIAIMMTKLVQTPNFEEMAKTIVSYIDPMSAIRMWVTRAITTVRCEKERLQLCLLLDKIAQLQIPELSAAALAEGVQSTMHSTIFSLKETFEDAPKLWKCWAQIIAADKENLVFSQNMNTAMLAEALKVGVPDSVLTQLLQDVLAVNNGTSPWPVPSEENSFARFRFLPVLVEYQAASKSGNPRWLLGILNKPKLIKSDVEVETFCVLTTKGSKEKLFESYRKHPQVQSPAFAAKVFSAVLCAEAADQTVQAEDSIPLLTLVSDSPTRELTECAMLAEQYLTLSVFRNTNHVTQALKHAKIVSFESIERIHSQFSQNPTLQGFLSPLQLTQ